MSSLVNQVQLVGRIGADAEVKITNQGKKLCNFRMATNESSKQVNGTWKEITMWHNCVVWGELTKVLEKYGKKGNQFMIKGSLNYREYEDVTGNKKNVTEIKVDSILLLSSSKNEEPITKKEWVDDIPF